MPTNLPPEAMDKWELIEQAHTPKEKMDAMIEFLKYVPHHTASMHEPSPNSTAKVDTAGAYERRRITSFVLPAMLNVGVIVVLSAIVVGIGIDHW